MAGLAQAAAGALRLCPGRCSKYAQTRILSSWARQAQLSWSVPGLQCLGLSSCWPGAALCYALKLQEPQLDSSLEKPPVHAATAGDTGACNIFSQDFPSKSRSLLSHVSGSQFSAQQGLPAPVSTARVSSNSVLPSPDTLQGHYSPQHFLHYRYPSHPPGCSWQQTTQCSPSTVRSPVLAACTPQWTCMGTSTESPFANVFWGPASCNLLDPALGPRVNLASPHCSKQLQPPPSRLQLPSSGKGPLKTVPSPLEKAAIRPKSPPVSFLGRRTSPQYL